MQQQLQQQQIPAFKCLQFRHDCQHLGCSNLACPQCMLCQRRRCIGNFAPKYLAPCDVLEAKCGAQVYVVVVDVATGALVQADLGDTYLQLSLIDGRKLEAEGDLEDALDSCQLLLNKAGQPLLVHGRSGSYTDDHRVMVPMISGQAMLPDLKVTDSSEALLTGRAPPFRLLARVVQRGGIPFPGIAPVLSEPFVVATARVKGAAKAEIPHVDDHVSKVEGLGVQTQKKLEDIAAAAVAAGVPNVQVPINCVTKVGQFRELVETAERNKPLRETLKQVLRLTKGWDVARDHVRRAVHTDVQLRVYHPDGRTDVGLVYKCGTFNVVEINRPVGLLRRRQTSSRPDQELVDVIWLSVEASAWPEAVRRIVPRAASAWWQEGHPGWGFLPLSLGHLPLYGDDGKPSPPMSSYSFTMRPSPPASVLTGAGGAHPAVSNGAVPGLLLPGMVPIAPAAQVPSSTGAPVAPIEAPVSTAAAPQAAPQLPPGLPHPWAQFKANPPDLAALGNLGALPGVAGEHLPAPSSDTLPNIGGPTLGSGDTKIETGLSPFEDPSFQQLMQLVAGSTPPTSGQPAVPKSGDSDGGAKGKRKADASLETWMAMHKSLDYDFDLPSTLAGMESLLGSAGGLSGNSKDGAPTSTGALPAPVPPAPASNPSAVASGDAYIIPGSLDFFAAAQQQRAQQRVQKTADAAAAAQAQAQVQPQQPVKVEAAPEKAREAAAAAAAPLPDAAPAQFPPGMTMADLRQLFARAVRQEITFEEVERQLGQQGLLPQETASEEELPAIQPLHSGLDDMRSIENGLPNYNADEDMPAVGGQGGVAV